MRKVLLCLFLIPALVSAQQFPVDLQQQLDRYYQSYMPIKVHVFTNQPEYTAGDTVFFAASLFTAQGHRPVSGKSILTAALLDGFNRKISEQQFSILNGRGANYLVLQANLPPGQYFISVRNQWMIDSRSVPGTASIRVGIATATSLQKLRARPEGGILVNGLRSRIAISGLPNTRGTVNENGVAIAEFTIDLNGTTSLYITPQIARKYTVNSDDATLELQEVQSDGVIIRAKTSPDKTFARVQLVIPDKSNYSGRPIHLIASMQGVIWHATEIIFKTQSTTTLEIPLEEIPEGVMQFTLFDSAHRVISERLFYNPKTSAISVNASLAKPQFHTREKIDLRVSVLDSGNPVNANVTITAFHNGFTRADTTMPHRLTSDLFLSSDVGYVSTVRSSDAVESIDENMILSTWMRFDWSNLNKRSDGAFYSQYMSYSGRAFDAASGRPIPDGSKITFFMQKNANTYQASTNRDGRFILTMLFDFFGRDEVFYRAEKDGTTIPGARVSIDADSLTTLDSEVPKFTKSRYDDLSDKRNAISRSYHYSAGKESFGRSKSEPLEDEMFGPDVTINLRDYQLFPTMVETLREIVPFSQHRVVRGKNIVRIYDHDAELFRSEDPVYVIDGVMTDDTEYFLSLNPADLVSIKIVHHSTKLNALGSIGKGGLIVVETKIPDNALHVPRSQSTISLTGLNAPVTRADVKHTAHTLRSPDLRTNLLWQPNLVTDSNGNADISFFGSDIPGHYKIVGEGMTSDGKPFVFEKDFELVFESVLRESN